MSQSEVITIYLPAAVKAKLEALAHATQRTETWLVVEAIAQYLEEQTGQIQQIEAAVALADQPEAQWLSEAAVTAWLESWGTEHERPAPCQ